MRMIFQGSDGKAKILGTTSKPSSTYPKKWPMLQLFKPSSNHLRLGSIFE
jgi:hypothetical protein